MSSYLFQGYLCERECNEPRRESELGPLISRSINIPTSACILNTVRTTCLVYNLTDNTMFIGVFKSARLKIFWKQTSNETAYWLPHNQTEQLQIKGIANKRCSLLVCFLNLQCPANLNTSKLKTPNTSNVYWFY